MIELPISKTRIYKIYQGMKDRCYNPKSPHYKTYGGRGIGICQEWIGDNGIQLFIEWSLNNGYNDNLTIDRIDNDNDYSPNNCQWVTRSYNSAKGNLNIEYIKTDCDKEELFENSQFQNRNIPLYLAIKSFITQQGFTMSQVNDELNRRHKTFYTLQNFSNRLRKESFSYTEVEEILDVIGYRIEWIKN